MIGHSIMPKNMIDESYSSGRGFLFSGQIEWEKAF